MIPPSFGRAWRRVTRLADAGRPVILMYHRIGEPGADPWSLAVSPMHFAQHMEVLAQRRAVVALDALSPARGGARPQVAITFDDGYAGVIAHALPVLERHGFPATIFVTTGMLGNAREFWWDELTRIVLEHTGRCAIDVTTPHGKVAFGRFGPATPQAGRRALHNRLWRELRPLPARERREWLAALADAVGCPLNARDSHRVMTPAEVSATTGGIVSIGAHGCSHAPLAGLGSTALRDEIAGSRDRCAELTGSPPDCFAYPFGDYDDASVAAVREAGFQRAVTVRPGVLRRATDPLRLPRIQVRDWDAATFAMHLP